MGRAAWCTAVALMLAMHPALGQRAKTIFTPMVGAYAPLTDLGSVTISVNGQPVTATARMQTAPLFGARFGYYPRGRVGVEASYFYAASKSKVQVTTPVGPLGREQDAHVQGGSVKLAYRVTDGRTDTDFVFNVGLSGTQRDGDLFSSTLAQGQFDLGAVAGAGLHLVMSPQVTLRVEGELNSYTWSHSSALGSKRQADFLLTAGLGLRLGR